MEIKILKNYIDYKKFIVNKEYDVYFYDSKWLCSCSFKHKRNINIKCKHIKECMKVPLE